MSRTAIVPGASRGIGRAVAKRLAKDGFTVAVIPHTTAVTTLGSRPPGSHVNLEVDVTAKYIEKLVAAHVAEISGGQK